MNELFEKIHEKVRIEVVIENIERNIAIKYMHSVLVFFLALCVLVVATELGKVGYSNLYIIGLCYSILGFCLTGYLLISGYYIRKKLNLILEEIKKDKDKI